MVHIAGGGSFAQQPGDRILHAALRAGLVFPYECNAGSCGCCRFELISGSVDVLMPGAAAWTERDRRKGRYLACQTSASSECTIRASVHHGSTHLPVPSKRRAVLISSRPLTHDLTCLTFQVEGRAEFQPGQYAIVSFEGEAEGRCYSMSNLPNEDGHLEFIVRNVPGGSRSGRFSNAGQETTFTIDGPFGNAYLRDEHVAEIICIAGGSGLAPMLSVMRAAVERGIRVHFFYGGRRPRDLNCMADLQAAPEFSRLVHVHAAVSAPEEEDATWHGDRLMLPDLVRREIGRGMQLGTCYAAGAPALITALEALLVNEHGLPPDRLYYDRFF